MQTEHEVQGILMRYAMRHGSNARLDREFWELVENPENDEIVRTVLEKIFCEGENDKKIAYKRGLWFKLTYAKSDFYEYDVAQCYKRCYEFFEETSKVYDSYGPDNLPEIMKEVLKFIKLQDE